MDFADWLTSWLTRHPLKAPADADRSRFTAEVMASVKAQTQPRRDPASGAARFQSVWARLAVSLAAAAAAVLVGLTVFHPSGSGERLATQLAQESELLASVGEPVHGWAIADDADGLAEDLEREDTLVLAEAPPSDDSWVADTLQLLDQLDEELPDDASSESNEDDWLDELQMLDENELAARS
jgi:hypothetical protein